VKYLIDPNYVNSMPYNLVPDTLASLTGLEFLRNMDIVCNLKKEAFSRFDGVDLNFTLAGLFKGEENTPRWKKIDKLKRKNWKIYAFHGGHENLNKQFSYMETNLAEDTKITRAKILSQLEVAQYLSSFKDSIIVYHLGLVKRKDKDYKATLKNLEFAVKEAENRNLIIAVENTPRAREGAYIGSDYRDIKKILEEIQGPNLGVCFDWGHANNYARVFAEENKRGEDYIKSFGYQKEIIEEFNKKIIYSHIHYNKNHLKNKIGEADDEHLPLTRIPPDELHLYGAIMDDLMQKTSIKQHDCILLELMSRKVFGFYEFWPTGSTREEQYKSLYLLKKMIEK